MSEKRTKTIELVAGPNGSGKSTFAESFLVRQRKQRLFINPDAIAAGVAPTNAEEAAFAAGRLMLSAVKETIQRGKSFAFESTISGKTWLPILKAATDDGYKLTIYFLFLNDVRQNLKRISDRVKAGGHNIPRQTVLRRYPRSFDLFWNHYRMLAHNWYLIDNSNNKPAFVMSSTEFDSMDVVEKEAFVNKFLRPAQNGKKR